MKSREKLSSRLGFILISAGCAVGLGNVWRFPYITGQYGGAAFVLLYLVFLILLGLPIMVMEFSVGRASQRSAAKSFDLLEPEGTKWHLIKYVCMGGNYLLMMFYTTVGGWMINYCLKMASGTFEGLRTEQVGETFSNMLASPGQNLFWMIAITVIGFFICSRGLQNGVEKMSKYMMSRFSENDGKRLMGRHIRSYGTGVFHSESWNRCSGNLWKLYRKRPLFAG